MLSVSLPAFADPPAASPATPVLTTPATVSPLNKGQPAPFTGVLLSPPAVAQIIAEHDTAGARLALAVQHQVQLDAAELKYQIDSLTTTCTADKSILLAQVDDQKRQVVILNEQLAKASGGWPPSVWIGIGAVGGVVLTVLTVFALGQVTK